jgi:hypothetical protein
VREDLLALGVNEEKAGALATQWDGERTGLTRAALEAGVGVNALTDLDWRFGVTAASSELSAVGSAFLQLRLSFARAAGGPSSLHMGDCLPVPSLANGGVFRVVAGAVL